MIKINEKWLNEYTKYTFLKSVNVILGILSLVLTYVYLPTISSFVHPVGYIVEQNKDIGQICWVIILACFSYSLFRLFQNRYFKELIFNSGNITVFERETSEYLIEGKFSYRSRSSSGSSRRKKKKYYFIVKGIGEVEVPYYIYRDYSEGDYYSLEIKEVMLFNSLVSYRVKSVPNSLFWTTDIYGEKLKNVAKKTGN